MGMENIALKTDKKTIFQSVEEFLKSQELLIKNVDTERPWGGFFVIDEKSLKPFLNLFFQDVEFNKEEAGLTLSPKVLLVQPGKRLSWQYHFRRSEYWKVANGKVGIVRSDSDEETSVETYETGEQIYLKQGERHRLVGLDHWGVVAEIWKHTDPSNPSDEEDIVRLDDDFGR